MAGDQYRGEKVEINFDGRRCIRSRMCVLARPNVFVSNADGAWIRPDAADRELPQGTRGSDAEREIEIETP